MDCLPKMMARTKETLEGNKMGSQLLDTLASKESTAKMQKFGISFFQLTFGIFGDVYAILFIGVFMALSPNTYIDGL